MATIEKVSDADFAEKILQADRPVLVDFTASWCGPCKAMAPAIEDLAREYDGEAAVYLVDIDESPDARHAQGIMGVPTFMIFNRGEMVERFTGSMSRSKLAAALEAAIEATR